MKTGGMAGRGKRGLLEEFALLVLTKHIVTHHPDAWTEDDIRARSTALTKAICAVWLSITLLTEPPTERV